jgi:predicted nucleic acid-binding protein
MYLLWFSGAAQDALWGRLERGTPRILHLEEADYPRMRELMLKYRSLPMDLADAALVRLAEREKITSVFTIDRTDFEVYRPAGGRRFRIIP